MKIYKVKIEPQAQEDLKNIYNFISSNDSKVKARRFLRKLQSAIIELEYMPNRFRKSIYIKRDNIHDMVVYGYTICYVIQEKSVNILAVFMQRDINNE